MTDSTTPTVLVAISPSPSGRAALRRAVQEALRRRARLHLVRVWQDVPQHRSPTKTEVAALRQQERAEQAILAEATSTAQLAAPELDLVFEFVPGDLFAAVSEAAEDADLLVLGAGRPETASSVITEWFGKNAPCPVVVVDVPIPVGAGLPDAASS